VKTKAARGSKADKDKDKDTAKDDGSVQLYWNYYFYVLLSRMFLIILSTQISFSS